MEKEAAAFTPGFNGVPVTWSLVFYVCFVDHCLSFCTFPFGHCVVCSSLICGSWLHIWYLLTILLSVLLWYVDSDDTFGIFWPFYCLFFDIQILMTPLVSFDHSIVCSSLICGFWWHLWYLLTILLSVLWYTDSDDTFDIFKLFLWWLCFIHQ